MIFQSATASTLVVKSIFRFLFLGKRTNIRGALPQVPSAAGPREFQG
jgi:hypothetical protein